MRCEPRRRERVLKRNNTGAAIVVGGRHG